MRRVLLVSLLALGAAIGTAEAGDRRSNDGLEPGLSSGHKKSSYYRRKPQVRGYVARRGGYSYSYEDTINTYGDARTSYGSIGVYRDRMLDRQTLGGPFDNDFFFDSGIGPRNGNAPY
jgi:hypothetical protein